jgi:hypothetical protein
MATSSPAHHDSRAQVRVIFRQQPHEFLNTEPVCKDPDLDETY